MAGLRARSGEARGSCQGMRRRNDASSVVADRLRSFGAGNGTTLFVGLACCRVLLVLGSWTVSSWRTNLYAAPIATT